MVSPSKRDKGWRQAKIGSWRKERTSCGTASNVRYLTLMADCRGRPNQPGFEPDKNTFHPLADVSFQWVAKSSSSSSMIAKKSVIHSTWSHSPSIWLKEWRFIWGGPARLEWSKSEVILRNLSSSANLGFVLKEIHFLVCFAQQFYWRGDKVQGRGKAQLTLG